MFQNNQGDWRDISIEPFRSDWDALESMALTSWREEYGVASFPNFYRPAFLHYLTDRIADKTHLLAAYRGEEILGFMANLPQKMVYKGKEHRAVYSCLLVVRKQFLRRGLATAIIEEALRLNRNYHYDFSLLTLETGHSSTWLMRRMAEAGQPMYFVKKIRVIARILDFERVCQSEPLKGWEKIAIKMISGDRPPREKCRSLLREYRQADLKGCLSLLNRYQATTELALVWDEKNLAEELAFPDVSQTLVYEKDGHVAGLINFIYHDHIGRTRERWAWVNHVAYPELSHKERVGFVFSFLHYVKQAGCVGVIEWTRGYYPLRPLYQARFFPYFRSVNLFSWSLNPEVMVHQASRVYEIQV